MDYQSYTPLGPNPIQPTVDTSMQALHFKDLPFFKIVKQLTKPMHLKSHSKNFGCIFNVSAKVKSFIRESLNIDSQEYRFQIILRLKQVGLIENFKDRLPKNITISVNGIECKLPKLNYREIVPRRNNNPIDITEKIVFRKNGLSDAIEITWSQEPHKYIGCVYMAQKLTCNDLLVELEKRPKRASDKTKELFKESTENDGDTLVDYLIASVKDPLSKLRMKHPARGVDCTHLQCFDAIQFLQMNEHILQSKDLTEECDNVYFFKDGTWSERNNREFSKNGRTNASRSTKNVVEFTLSDSDDEDNNESNWYEHLDISKINKEIKKVVERIDNKYRLEDIILSKISGFTIGSPVHRQLIDSMPSKNGESGSQNAEIIFEVTQNFKNKYCLRYINIQ
eukprot:XP_016657990.1 PREDICTED: E3 SUMO-protein ligase PIAS4-like [Acyrthosiphon pisum]